MEGSREPKYQKGSLSLVGTVALGTSVMIGAGIFALTGQVAEQAGRIFPLAFILAALVSGASAYTYIKVVNRHPSSGGIAMILKMAYGESTITGAAALMMAFSMIINESLVARTFGTYVLQISGSTNPSGALVPILALGLIAFAFIVNIAGNRMIETVANVSSILKVIGLLLFAAVVLAVSGIDLGPSLLPAGGKSSLGNFVGGVALAILAYKGFTTITNSGSEVVNPKRNVGRAIWISLGICLVVYLMVALAVNSSLSIETIITAKDYSLAEAARPVLGEYGAWATVAIAIIATASGLLASTFAVSRMLTMLTEMKLIPHRHFGMPGNIQQHLLVYTVVTAAILAVLFDLSRIASMGAILYLAMDIVIHWGVLRHLHKEVAASRLMVGSALVLDVVVLGFFIAVKWDADPLIVVVSLTTLVGVVLFEHYYLRARRAEAG